MILQTRWRFVTFTQISQETTKCILSQTIYLLIYVSNKFAFHLRCKNCLAITENLANHTTLKPGKCPTITIILHDRLHSHVLHEVSKVRSSIINKSLHLQLHYTLLLSITPSLILPLGAYSNSQN